MLMIEPFYDHFWRTTNRRMSDVWEPPFTSRLTKEGLVVSADLPGVKTEDLEVSVHQGILTIKGSRKGKGAFEKQYEMTEEVNTDDLKASLVDGVLTLTAPLIVPPKVEARKIPISGGG